MFFERITRFVEDTTARLQVMNFVYFKFLKKLRLYIKKILSKRLKKKQTFITEITAGTVN